MINKEQLKEIYKEGAFNYSEAQLKDTNLPSDVKSLLLETGLPKRTSTLGIHFLENLIPLEDGTLQIGYEWEPENLIVLEENGAIYSVDDDEKLLVNASLGALLLFLDYYEQYVESRKDSDPKPASSSREEMLKKIEAMKNGTLKPAPPRPKFDQKKAFKDMDAFFKKNDPVAVQDEESWWSQVLEQVEDDIL